MALSFPFLSDIYDVGIFKEKHQKKKKKKKTKEQNSYNSLTKPKNLKWARTQAQISPVRKQRSLSPWPK